MGHSLQEFNSKYPSQQSSGVDRKTSPKSLFFYTRYHFPCDSDSTAGPQALDICSRTGCAPCVHSYFLLKEDWGV